MFADNQAMQNAKIPKNGSLFMSASPEFSPVMRVLLMESNYVSPPLDVNELANSFGSEADLIRITSGIVAVELLRNGHFDILLIDLKSLDDLSLSTEEAILRLCRLAGDALVIALSDGDSISSSMAAMRAGAHDYITRPVNTDILNARIGNLARRHGKTRCMSGNFGGQATPDMLIPDMIGFSDSSGISNDNRKSGTFPVFVDEIKPMWRQEQKIIEDAVQMFNGNVAQAAAALEISPSTIYRKRQSWEQAACA